MSILDENPYELPLDEPELIRALLSELPDEVVRWLIAWNRAWVHEVTGELQRRRDASA